MPELTTQQKDTDILNNFRDALATTKNRQATLLAQKANIERLSPEVKRAVCAEFLMPRQTFNNSYVYDFMPNRQNTFMGLSNTAIEKFVSDHSADLNQQQRVAPATNAAQQAAVRSSVSSMFSSMFRTTLNRSASPAATPKPAAAPTAAMLNADPESDFDILRALQINFIEFNKKAMAQPGAQTSFMTSKMQIQFKELSPDAQKAFRNEYLNENNFGFKPGKAQSFVNKEETTQADLAAIAKFKLAPTTRPVTPSPERATSVDSVDNDVDTSRSTIRFSR